MLSIRLKTLNACGGLRPIEPWAIGRATQPNSIKIIYHNKTTTVIYYKAVWFCNLLPSLIWQHMSLLPPRSYCSFWLGKCFILKVLEWKDCNPFASWMCSSREPCLFYSQLRGIGLGRYLGNFLYMISSANDFLWQVEMSSEIFCPPLLMRTLIITPFLHLLVLFLWKHSTWDSWLGRCAKSLQSSHELNKIAVSCASEWLQIGFS